MMKREVSDLAVDAAACVRQRGIRGRSRPEHQHYLFEARRPAISSSLASIQNSKESESIRPVMRSATARRTHQSYAIRFIWSELCGLLSQRQLSPYAGWRNQA
jgi:hypothetical protein